jgi:DNA-binding HxlR family transcriptional regulator/putative sterol carrier protein
MSRRSYEQTCSLASGLDVLGERWTLLLVRELLLGPQRFSDLLDSLEGIGPNTLATRLRGMETDGLVTKRRLPPPAASTVYELTDRGEALEPVLLELARWGRPLLPAEPHDLHPGWVAFGLKTAFDPGGAEGLDLTCELRVDGEPYVVTIRGGRLDVTRGEHPHPDARIETDGAALFRLGNGELDLRAAISAGTVRFDGDRSSQRAWARSFSVVPASEGVPSGVPSGAPPARTRRPSRPGPRAR